MLSPHQAPLAEIYDLAVIGGGINGTGIAADAAGRGLSVFLCEQDDLASHTSSASSKLIHGGLRYLEQHAWRLVREALAEREILMRKAPHLVRPLQFILPHQPRLRPAWLIRCGLFLYDRLASRQRLPASRALRLDPAGPLQPAFVRGFSYYDCRVDDARLVLLNAIAAREQRAHIHTRTRCLSARRSKGLWHLQLERRDGSRFSVRARALVNAAGPWADRLLPQLQQPLAQPLRLVAGSHLVVPRLYAEAHAYILQHSDRRILFIIPWLEHFSLIGTTDREFSGVPGDIRPDDSEVDYLLAAVNNYLRHPLGRDDILHSFAGIRALHAGSAGSAARASRDYLLQLQGDPPLLTVYGGKLTTYRRLAEAALEQLTPFFPGLGPAWTATAVLPGAEQLDSADALALRLCERHPWLDAPLARRWAGSYGSRSWHLLQGVTDPQALGQHFGAGLYAREVDYLCREEWARTAEDILWRRSKLGLLMPDAGQQALADYLEKR